MPPASYERELGRIEAEVKELKDDVDELRVQLNEANQRLQRIEHELKEYKQALDTVVSILGSFTTLARFAKWTAAVIGGIAALIAALAAAKSGWFELLGKK